MRRIFFMSLVGLVAACGGQPAATRSQISETNVNMAQPEAGRIDIMNPADAAALRALMPRLANPEIQGILHSAATMWYDNASMPRVYQDSVTPVLGVRANSIGRGLAVEGDRIFDTDERFHFPYGHTAGMDDTTNTYIATFWSPPPAPGGGVLPVVYYNDSTTRWRWMFPVGTVFGEAMFMTDNQGNKICFEIRIRKRYADGWAVDAFRPYNTAADLADAIIAQRPDWRSATRLATAVNHLRNNATLTNASLAPRANYAAAFDRVDGALDNVPDLGDWALVRQIITTKTFTSAEGTAWKRNGNKETYAAAGTGIGIVPAGYMGGLIPVNEVSCARCHEDTGRQIGEFNFNSLLYGEIWGEDKIFSWHLFDESGNFYGAYDNNRILSRRFAAAGLVERYDPTRHDAATYKELPRRFSIIWR